MKYVTLDFSNPNNVKTTCRHFTIFCNYQLTYISPEEDMLLGEALGILFGGPDIEPPGILRRMAGICCDCIAKEPECGA